MHPKIQRAAATDSPPPRDLLIILYGVGGIGKTSTACQAPAPLVLDCAGGLRFQRVDTWKIGGPADLAEAVAYLKTATRPPNGAGASAKPVPPCPYQTIILDGLDYLYHRAVRGEPGRDLRDRHRAAQEAIHPLLLDLWSLPLTKIVVLNERHERDERGGRERVEMDLPPRMSELVDGAADLLLRCEPRGAETLVRARRCDDGKLAIQAKTRTDMVKDGARLRDVWGALGLR